MKLEKCLKWLNPNIVFADREEAHRVKNWKRYLPKEFLKLESFVQSNIYNDGRLEIHSCGKINGKRINYYLYQRPINKFTRDCFPGVK